jgi:hypothetical protein
MTRICSVIGVDPGQACGIAFVDYMGDQIAGRTMLQVDHASALIVLEAMLLAHYSDPERVPERWAGVEAFITGNSAGTKGKPAELTRQLVMRFGELLQMYGYRVKVRPAASVKPWATNRVLEAAGILQEATGMRHANDGGRQALFTARWDAGKPSPLR